MEKQEVRSKWDELARELGAETPPEIERPKPAPPIEEAAAAPVEPAKPRTPPPKRAESDWNQLAGDLGLPPSPEPPPRPPMREPPLETRPAARPPAKPAEPPRAASTERSERIERPERTEQRPERTEQRPERTQRSREGEGRGRRPQRQDQRQAESARNDREERPQEGEQGSQPRRRRGGRRSERDDRGERKERDQRDDRGQRRGRDDHAAEVEPPRDRQRETRSSAPAAESPTERPQLPVDEPPAKPAGGVSLWQKIFGSPAAAAPKPAEPDVKRAVDDDARSYSGEYAEQPFPETGGEFSTAEAIDVAFRSVEAGDESGDVREDEPDRKSQAPGDRKPRRARRRRGGRGRKSEDRGEGRRPAGRNRDSELMETPGADDFDDDFDDLPVGDADESEDDAELSLDDDQESIDGDEPLDGETAPARGRVAGHRSIPPWEEAIGIIVDTNMQNRSQRRPASNGGQRGRPRGGRRRRKPS